MWRARRGQSSSPTPIAISFRDSSQTFFFLPEAFSQASDVGRACHILRIRSTVSLDDRVLKSWTFARRFAPTRAFCFFELAGEILVISRCLSRSNEWLNTLKKYG